MRAPTRPPQSGMLQILAQPTPGEYRHKYKLLIIKAIENIMPLYCHPCLTLLGRSLVFILMKSIKIECTLTDLKKEFFARGSSIVTKIFLLI